MTGLKVAVILLAAGLSRRMGDRNKLLIEVRGEPLVRHTAKAYIAAGADVYAVLGHEAERVGAALADLRLTFVQNPNFADGQQTSVRAGLEALAGDYDAVLVALSDQIALTSPDISDLLHAFAESSRDRILIPYYKRERGNPVVFPAHVIADIRASERNAACRAFIDGNPELTKRYEAANDHFVIDIDTPEDLHAFEVDGLKGTAA